MILLSLYLLFILNSNITDNKPEVNEVTIAPLTQNAGTVYYYESQPITVKDGYACGGLALLYFDGGTSVCMPRWNSDNNTIGLYVYGKITNGQARIRYTLVKIF